MRLLTTVTTAAPIKLNVGMMMILSKTFMIARIPFTMSGLVGSPMATSEDPKMLSKTDRFNPNIKTTKA